MILDAIADTPATVAQIARRRGIARQAVQRVANLLERDGLATYVPNPGHRRAKLLASTEAGREVLRTINQAQKTWADALGDAIGEAKLKRIKGQIETIRRAVGGRATGS